MKICPKCNNKYTDQTLSFCLQDGTELVSESERSGSHPTVSFEETATVISSKKPKQISFDLNQSNERNWDESQATKVSTMQGEPKSSKTLIAVLLTALIMLVLFSVAGVGAYLYFNNGKTEVAVNRNNAGNSSVTPDNNTKAQIDLNTAKPEKSEELTPSKTVEKISTPTPDSNPGETKKEIESRILTWKTAAESIDLNSYMNNYAERIDYYRKNGASKSFVRNDKQKAFNKYDSMKIQLSNVNIKQGNDGQTAIAVIDKAWDFSSIDSNNSGKVQQQLKLKKVGEKWLITSEKDLKVYYVNK